MATHLTRLTPLTAPTRLTLRRRIARIGIILTTLGAASAAGSAVAEPNTHDGFFLNMSLGPGVVSGDVSLESSRGDSDLESGGGTGQLQLGTTVGRGIILGGSLGAFVMTSPEVRNVEVKELQLSLLSAFLRIYSDPTGGFFYGGQLGFASLSRIDNDDSRVNAASGLALGPTIGYEWWVSESWSLGIEGRILYAVTEKDSFLGTEQYSMFLPSAMFSATYN
jgi:hypothetical protein